MLDWNDYLVILTIARHKSLYRAAQALRVAVSTMMRRLAQIEERAGMALFRKTKEGYIPTSVGLSLISKAEKMETLTQSAEQVLKAEIYLGQKKNRISASEVIAPFFVAKHLPALREHCPNCEISLTVMDKSPSENAEAFDISLWPSTPSNEALFGRRLTKVKWAFFGVLSKHSTDEISPPTIELFGRKGVSQIMAAQNEQLDETFAHVAPEVSTNSLIASAAMAATGETVAYLPCVLGANWPQLIQLSPSSDHEIGELWMIYRKSSADTPHIRHALNVLIRGAEEDKHLFLGSFVS